MSQPKTPLFKNVIGLLYAQHEIKLQLSDIIDLEESVLRALEFSCHHVTPIQFLERFLRVFGVDQGELGTDTYQIRILAH